MLRFHNLNSPCMRISSHIDVYGPSEDDYRLFIENSMTYVFVSSGFGLCKKVSTVSKFVVYGKNLDLIKLPYWYLISRVFNFAFFAIVKKSRN